MQSYDVIIIGAGVMGASAACELSRQGERVALIDQSILPNPRGASIDHSKVFRFAYPDALYVKMAARALKLWRELEEETAARLLTKTGALLLGTRQPSFETLCYDAIRELSYEVEMLSKDETVGRFPQFDPGAFSYAVFDPFGAILHAETAVRALIDLARRSGVQVIEGERVKAIEKGGRETARGVITDSGNRLSCRSVVVASGPWTREFIPRLSSALAATRQEVFYFEPDEGASSRAGGGFDAESFPIFIALDTGFYGFPVHHGGAMKIANHNKGEAVDPYSVETRIEEESVEKCREFFRSYIPALAGARLKDARVCMYNNTANDDFLIDWHPDFKNVLLVTGFSGHGFKFGPLIGRIASELLLTGHPSYPIDRFRLRQESGGGGGGGFSWVSFF
jgi:monomeric sarcosine oxidase